jgi:hypothetical protein
MLTLCSLAVALGCVLVSARRLLLAIEATALDPDMVVNELRGAGDKEWAALRDKLATRVDAPWEKDVLGTLEEVDPRAREAGIDEQLLEVDWRVQRWSRVPRVCASIATSAGFLFASIGLLRGLANPTGEAGEVRAALLASLDALAVGVAATAFCAAVHVRTRRLVRERIAAAERLLLHVRTLASLSGLPGPATDGAERSSV